MNLKRWIAALLTLLIAIGGISYGVDRAQEAPGRRIVAARASFGNLRYFDAGNATMPDGGNNTTVSHDLGTTPDVALAIGTSSDTEEVWISSLLSGNLTINVPANVSGNVTMYWIVGKN